MGDSKEAGAESPPAGAAARGGLSLLSQGESEEPSAQGSALFLGGNEVKSRAVVKYSSAPPRTAFARLEEKTDLKLPPANWLRESAKLGPAGTTILGNSKKSKPFSSFGMAYDFIDSVGNDVDVVSDSENIKKLLKIPYSKSHVSMAVHRIGRTLLLDELDIQELFMRSSQTGDWTWLKEFYQRLIDQKWQRKKKSKEHWYQKAILSKFLYYSINGDGAAQPVPSAAEQQGPSSSDQATDSDGASWPAPFEMPSSVSEDPSASSQALVFSKIKPVVSGRLQSILWKFFTEYPRDSYSVKHTLDSKTRGCSDDDVSRIIWLRVAWLAQSVEHATLHHGVGSEPLEPSYIVGHVASAPKEQNLTTLFNDGENSQGLKNDFVRNILWTFEDIHMLVGSNMPIFGGGRYPAVSLRLRDNNKPINVLTGIDYWLDNLICNVPELVMCFHVNGIVQKYEMIKTEEIPNLENSNFSTKVIKDIAQNILSFLKSNCTKEGHTYWLFKASGSDIVKLYDLTTLCEETEDKYQNPFTMPVAILLYKVACNMMMKKNQNKKHYGTIRTLLLNCVKLLDKSRHPQIIASANYMLSELFQLDEPKKEESSESPLNENSDESYSEEEEELADSDENGSYGTGSDPSDDNKAVAIIKSVGELSVPEKYKSIHQIRPSCTFPVCHDTEERCRLVLSYVLEGLKSVDSSIKKESDLPAADPNTPIPLKYEDESTRGGPEGLEKQMALFLDKMGSLQKGNYSSQSGMIPGSWQHKMKLQLILKSSKAYYVLSDAAMSLQKYGRALRYIKLALQSHDTYCCLCTNMLSEVLLFLSQYLTLCGDIQLMLAQNANNRAAHLEEFNYQTKEDQEILHSLHRESPCQGFAWATDLSTDLESQLSVSCKCYEAANEILQFSDLKSQNPEHYVQVLKRMGNIRNEIGVFYMNQAAALQSERVVSKSVSTAEQQLWKKSFSCFEKGIHNFESIDDATNAALLLCNTGRLMRICAQAHCGAGDEFKREFSPEEGLYYNKAVDYYLKALRSLGTRDIHPAVWDSVNWELSTTYFTMATLQQDYAPLSRKAQEQIEKEVSEAMMKSLKHCDVDSVSARQPLCQYRAATIHHRLASMYHSCLRNQVGDEHLRKQHRVLADLHYSKAVKLFQLLKDAPCELLRVQLERVAFAEFQMTSQNSNVGKLKTLSGALDIMVRTKHAFQLIRKELVEEFDQPKSDESAPAADPSPGLSREEVIKLLSIFESRLSFLLLQSIKLLSSTKKKTSNTEEDVVLKTNKQIYSQLLRATANRNSTLLERIDVLIQLLDQLARGGSGGQ
ncbi:erythroid differentiation-related factor 1 isoform X2 [Neofelis nebulosa]|uniref:erythroid differentiation-related factor 1 isoform X2 n=1 Tax=Neofelis nebulosa TaxID=61452 RepID=UPI002729D928|nr:erythroid differentiation-related factor 1 isoform X2 [Neofelis nebulosa]